MASVEQALDVAGAAAGDHVVDLGCGDGQVLVAAARRGCRVTGVECDAELAEHARTALAENDLPGEVVVGDVFEFPIDDAVVLFTYLAPATLQRLSDRFQHASGARLVTVDFEVPGLLPDVVEGSTHLYRLPANVKASVDRAGWQADGVLVAVTPERHSLTCLLLHGAGGDVFVEAVGDIARRLTAATGVDRAVEGAPVAVDIRWEELALGVFTHGALRCPGVPDLAVFALVTHEDEGLWDVTQDGVDRLRRKAADGWVPATFAELVAGCDA